MGKLVAFSCGSSWFPFFSPLEGDTGQKAQQSLNLDLLCFSCSQVCALCSVVILALLISSPFPSWVTLLSKTQRCTHARVHTQTHAHTHTKRGVTGKVNDTSPASNNPSVHSSPGSGDSPLPEQLSSLKQRHRISAASSALVQGDHEQNPGCRAAQLPRHPTKRAPFRGGLQSASFWLAAEHAAPQKALAGALPGQLWHQDSREWDQCCRTGNVPDPRPGASLRGGHAALQQLLGAGGQSSAGGGLLPTSGLWTAPWPGSEPPAPVAPLPCTQAALGAVGTSPWRGHFPQPTASCCCCWRQV